MTAGPVEAAVCGNVLVQAIAAGRLSSIGEGRQLLASGLPLRRYTPRDEGAWDEAAEKYRAVEAVALGRA